MSELKADKTFVFGEECLAYKKSEADKVIAELKEKALQYKVLYKEMCRDINTMAIELHHLNTHGMMEQACDVLDGVVRLKARIAELEKENSELRSKNEGLLYALADAETDLAESQRWRKFSEDKPSEEMEGEDFIVSNGYYSVVCEWRGYWNNEPFCGDKNCDVVKYWKPLTQAPKEEK